MYNHEITIDAANPSKALPDLCVGLLSAATLKLSGVPTAASSVQVIFTSSAIGVPYSYTATAASGVWSVKVDEGFFNPVGRWRYEVVITADNGRYWSAAGGVNVVKATVSGIVPEPVDPTHGRNVVLSVNGNDPDEHGEVTVSVTDTDAVRFTSQTLTDQQKSQARANIAGASSADLTSHTGNTSNPHSVTAAQVGALPLSGGTMTGNIILPNGKGIEFFDNTASVAILEVNPDYADDGRIYLPAQTGTLALKSEIPAAVVVDQALNASSTNPLANSAVAASLPYALVTQTSAEFTATDRAVNVVDVAEDELVVNMPSSVSGKARDFIIYIQSADGDETISFDGDIVYEESSAVLLESGINIVSFTEMKSGVFFVSRKLVEEGV